MGILGFYWRSIHFSFSQIFMVVIRPYDFLNKYRNVETQTSHEKNGDILNNI